MRPALPFRPISRSSGHCAFTLVEMLVAMSILALLIVLVAQLTNSATTVTTISNKRVDADSQARLAFSRMAIDFNGMLNRKDVDCFFVKNGSSRSDAMYFYTESPGYFSDQTKYPPIVRTALSFTGYRISHHAFAGDDAAVYPDNVLERIGWGMLYGYATTTPTRRNNVTFLTKSSTGALPVKESTIPYDQDYCVGDTPTYDGNNVTTTGLVNSTTIIANGIFRMEFCFQVKDPAKYGGNKFAVPVTPGSSSWNNAAFAGIPTATTNFTNVSMRQVYSDVAAVVVTIAVLDPKSSVILTPANIADAETALADGDDPSVARTWITAINDGSFKTASKFPQIAASQVRVYQRFFPLNSN